VLTLASFLAENARSVHERLAGYLARRLGEPTGLSGAPWDERLRMLDDGRIDVAFICGLPYSERFDRPGRPIELLCAPVMAHPRYAGCPIYFTDAIVRRDSPARTFADLRGRVWAYNDEGSNSGYVMPRHHLLALGETRGYFARAVASGSHQQSIQMVRDGAADAAGIDSTVLELELTRCPALAPDLRVVESIGPCPIPPVVVGRHLPEARKRRLRDAFVALHEDAEARAILADGLIARFVPVTDADYDPIRAMVRQAVAAGFLTLR